MFVQNNISLTTVYVDFQNKDTNEIATLYFYEFDNSIKSIDLKPGDYYILPGVLNDNTGDYFGSSNYIIVSVHTDDVVSINTYVGDAEFTNYKLWAFSGQTSTSQEGVFLSDNSVYIKEEEEKQSEAAEQKKLTLEDWEKESIELAEKESSELEEYNESVKMDLSESESETDNNESINQGESITFNPNETDEDIIENSNKGSKSNKKIVICIIIVIAVIGISLFNRFKYLFKE